MRYLVLVSVFLLGCGTKQVVVNPPGPNTSVVVAIASAEAACEISATLVSPAAAQWLGVTCPTAITGIVDTIDANGAASQIQAAIATMQSTYAAIPAASLTQQDRTYITAAIAAATLALTIYQQESTAVYRRSLVTQAAFQAKPRKQMSADDKRKLQNVRKRAQDWKKKHAK